MELLIPGLLLVGFMVYFSTKLKKKSAAAFEREIVETDDFTVVKPDGFLNRIGYDSGYELDAYSKEFGVDSEANYRKALATITKYEELSAQEVAENDREEMTSVLSVENGERLTTIIGLFDIEELEYNVTHKIFSTNRGVFDLKMCVLPGYEEEFVNGLREMVESFEIK